MKNISRRVFIKGLAVAGVAAAASTVLAGCNTNMIPGVDEPSEDEGTETPSYQKVTLTDPDTGKSLTLQMTKAFQYISATNMGIISINADNQLGNIVHFDTDYATPGDDYFLTVTCKTTLENGSTAANAAALDEDTDANNAFLSSDALALASKDNKDTQIFLTMPDDPTEKKTWKTVEVTVSLCKNEDADNSGLVLNTGKFTFNK